MKWLKKERLTKLMLDDKIKSVFQSIVLENPTILKDYVVTGKMPKSDVLSIYERRYDLLKSRNQENEGFKKTLLNLKNESSNKVIIHSFTIADITLFVFTDKKVSYVIGAFRIDNKEPE